MVTVGFGLPAGERLDDVDLRPLRYRVRQPAGVFDLSAVDEHSEVFPQGPLIVEDVGAESLALDEDRGDVKILNIK